MSRPAVIYGHPAAMRHVIEPKTDRKAVIIRNGVEVRLADSCDLSDSETYDCPIHGDLGEEFCPRC